MCVCHRFLIYSFYVDYSLEDLSVYGEENCMPRAHRCCDIYNVPILRGVGDG